MIFPSALTGPIGNHAVDPSYFGTIKNIVINHHRFYGDLPLIDNKSKFSLVPYFIRSKNGLIITTYWIIPNIISLIIYLSNNVHTSFSFKNNINLVDHTVIIFTFTLLNFFYLIPAPSYTPWLTPIIIFLATISFLSIQTRYNLMFKLQRYIIFSVFTIIIIGSLKFSSKSRHHK